MNAAIKRWFAPLRRLAGRFVLVPEYNVMHRAIDADDLFHKAALLIADCKTEGDFYEFGVFDGRSFIHAYEMLRGAFAILSHPGRFHSQDDCAERRRIWHGMRFVAFDSFEGLPEPAGLDRSSRTFTKGKFQFNREHFEANLRAATVPPERVVIVPGWYHTTCRPETLVRYSLRKAAIVHIDCDLYESARDALSLVTGLLQEGTILIFDDWYHFAGNPEFGEQRAFREWSRAQQDWVFTEYQKGGAWSNSFIASKRVAGS